MPAINEHQHPSGVGSHQTTTNSFSNHGTYFIFSVAILITLAIRLQRRQQKREDFSNGSSISPTHKSIFSSAQTMQTLPTSSALPEKPFLPDLESASYDVGHQSVSRDDFETSQDSDSTTSSESSPDLTKAQLVSQDATLSHFHQQENTMQRSVSVHLPQTRRPGSLIHPEPPTPTISMKEPNMTIQTQLPHKPAQEYHFEDLQPEYQAQYIYNEILFVPSPTEYTSYEALYSKFPPPIYHEPNPTSYTSISDSEISEAESRSFTTSSFSSETNTDHQHSQDFPRRRSYTKTLRNGSEMSGEIVISGKSGEGHASRQWRRHTKVFGGGICMACEGNESRRMSA